MAQIASVAAITGTGKAFAVNEQGVSRELKAGDVLQKGETIRTVGDVQVELLMEDGRLMAVAPNQVLRLDENVSESDQRPTAQDSAVGAPAATADTILQALERGTDLSTELEATAAGLGGAGGADGGSSFVQLLRITEGVDPLSYNYSFKARDVPPGLQGASEVLSATEPPATEPPATEPPATEPPATEPPATEPPATEPPATEPPATEERGGWFISHQGNTTQAYSLIEGSESSRQSTDTFNVQFQERSEKVDKLGDGESVTVVIDISGTASLADFAILDVKPSKEFSVEWKLNSESNTLEVTLTNKVGEDVNLQGNPFDVTVHAVTDAVVDGGERLIFDIRSATIGNVWESNDSVQFEITDDGVGLVTDNVLQATTAVDSLSGLAEQEDRFVWTSDDMPKSNESAQLDMVFDFVKGEDTLDLQDLLGSNKSLEIQGEVNEGSDGGLLLQVVDTKGADSTVVQEILVYGLGAGDLNNVLSDLNSGEHQYKGD